MREFRITFAQCDSGGIVRPDIADALGKRLAATYGGFTRTDAQGGYIMADGRLVCESVFVFDVATESDAESVFGFAAMAAAEIRRAMDQESVYFRNIDGRVHILAAEKPERTAAKAGAFIPPHIPRVSVSFTPPLRADVSTAAKPRPERTAADADKPPESLASRARELRTIAQRMADADARRGGEYRERRPSAAAILTLAAIAE